MNLIIDSSEEYKVYWDSVVKIREESISRNEKWEKKFALTKQFIDTHKRFPYYIDKILNCDCGGNTKNEYRKNKIQALVNCNYVLHSGKVCGRHIGNLREVKEDPYKCYNHSAKMCPNCITWIDSRGGNPKYDGYCATCFKRLFPSDPRSTVIYEHSKEIKVRNAITERFTGFVHDKSLYTGACDCTHRRRVDHRKLIGNTILAIETDEFAHRTYDATDEVIRYDDLYMIHSGKWIFIRFNPDHIRTCTIDLEDRIKALLDEIEKQIHRIELEENTELLEIIKLFY